MFNNLIVNKKKFNILCIKFMKRIHLIKKKKKRILNLIIKSKTKFPNIFSIKVQYLFSFTFSHFINYKKL